MEIGVGVRRGERESVGGHRAASAGERERVIVSRSVCGVGEHVEFT